MMGGGIFSLLIVGLLVYLFLNYNNSTHGRFGLNNDKNTEDALEILRKRYVNGEVSDEEYQRKKSILEDRKV
ncbi:SHOCT domain-containing protein [Bacillaceae bacterium S4-13-56]